MLHSTQEEQWHNSHYMAVFIAFHLPHYLFVFSVATLNNSCSHLLLFPERTTLCGEGKNKQSESQQKNRTDDGKWLTAACRAPTKSLLSVLPGLLQVWAFPADVCFQFTGVINFHI